MSPLTRRRIQLWLAWSAANGLSVGTMIWLLVNLDREYLKGGSTAIALLLSFGFVAGVQQVLLRSSGWSAGWWCVASYLGIGGAMLAGAFVYKFIGFFPAAFAFGTALGVIQMRVCEPLSNWPILWPVASGLGVAVAAVQFLLAMPTDPFTAYLSGLSGGAIYGIFTGLGLVISVKATSGADPATIDC